MLRLFGCRLEDDDADRLATALAEEGSETSLETAAAIRWGSRMDVEDGELEPELRSTLARASINVRSSRGLN